MPVMLLPCPWCGPATPASSARRRGRAPTRPGDGDAGGVAAVPVLPRQPSRLGARELVPRRRVAAGTSPSSGTPLTNEVRGVRDAVQAAGEGPMSILPTTRRRGADDATDRRLAAPRGEVIDRRRTLGVPLERHAVHAPTPGDTIASALAAAGRAGVLAQLQVPPPARAAHGRLPRPGLQVQVGDEPNVRGAHRLVEPGHGGQLAEHLAVAAVRRQGRQRAGRAVPGRRLLLQDVHQARAAVAASTRRSCAGSCTPARCRPTPTAATTTSATPTPTWWSRAAARPGWPPRSRPPAPGRAVMLVEEEHQLGGHLRWGGAGRPGRAAASCARRSPRSRASRSSPTRSSSAATTTTGSPIVQRSLPRRRRAADQGAGGVAGRGARADRAARTSSPATTCPA